MQEKKDQCSQRDMTRNTVEKRKRINRIKTIIIITLFILVLLPSIFCIILGIKVHKLQTQVTDLWKQQEGGKELTRDIVKNKDLYVKYNGLDPLGFEEVLSLTDLYVQHNLINKDKNQSMDDTDHNDDNNESNTVADNDKNERSNENNNVSNIETNHDNNERSNKSNNESNNERNIETDHDKNERSNESNNESNIEADHDKNERSDVSKNESNIETDHDKNERSNESNVEADREALDTHEIQRSGDKAENIEETENSTPGIYEGKKVYLTFDDGPSENTVKILDILKEYQVKATFFVIGDTDDYALQVYRRIVDEGHTLGMHSYSHQYDLIYKSVEDFDKDFTKLWKLLYDTTEYKPTIYRFPGGSSNLYYNNKENYQDIIKYLKDKGIVYFDWNALNGDATGVAYTEEQLINNVLDGVASKRRAIILMHDSISKKTTVDSLPAILDALISGGAELLPLDENVTPIQQIRAETIN